MLPVDLTQIATETQEIRGKLSACRSALRTNRERVATGEREEAELIERLATLRAKAQGVFDAIGAIGTLASDTAADAGVNAAIEAYDALANGHSAEPIC